MQSVICILMYDWRWTCFEVCSVLALVGWNRERLESRWGLPFRTDHPTFLGKWYGLKNPLTLQFAACGLTAAVAVVDNGCSLYTVFVIMIPFDTTRPPTRM